MGFWYSAVLTVGRTFDVVVGSSAGAVVAGSGVAAAGFAAPPGLAIFVVVMGMAVGLLCTLNSRSPDASRPSKPPMKPGSWK